MEKQFKIPVNLHLEARREMKAWLKSLVDRGIEIKDIHHGLCTLIAYSWNDFFNAVDIMKKEGSVVRETTARGNVVTKNHPAFKIITDSKNQIRLLEAELKLTPKSEGPDAIQGDLFYQNPALEKFKIMK